ALAVLQIAEVTDGLEDVFLAERRHLDRHFKIELVVDLQASYAGQIVLLRIEEEIVEKLARGIRGRRIARTETLVDLDQRLFLSRDLVRKDRIADVRTNIQVIDIKELDRLNLALPDFIQFLFCQNIATGEHDFTRRFVDDVVRQNTADDFLGL